MPLTILDRRAALIASGVESAARRARELGFNVTLALDATTDMSAEAHANGVTRIFPRMGETGAIGAIIELVDRA